MRKLGQNVEKVDSAILDTVKSRFLEIGKKLKITKTRTKTSFRGYGVKICRESETVTAGVEDGACDEG